MMRIIFSTFVLSLIFSFVINEKASAAALDIPCTDVEVIFARGSGQGINADESEKFFKKVDSRLSSSNLKTAVYELGVEEYGGHKYQAIQVSQAPYGNALGAKFSSGYANDYGKSVDSGVGELYNYLTQRYDKCKSTGTKFVLGGYSQGAQVVGQTLPKFTGELRSSIVFAAFFGDPKLHLPEGEGWNPPACQGKELSLYRRVIANCDVDNGSLGARKPYLPDDMKAKSGLWCYEHDYVCGVTHNVFDNDGHMQYKDDNKAIDQAALEIAKRVKTQLPPATGSSVDTKPHGTASGNPDVVYVIDTTGSMGGRIAQTKEFVRTAANKIQELNGRVALVAYRDSGDAYTAKVVTDFTTDLTAFQAQLDSLNVDGGGDTPEATLHALTTAFNGLSWRNGATKAAVVLTDAGYHAPDRVDGSTVESVAKRSLEIDPVNVYPVVPSYLASTYQSLADQTTGKVIADSGDTVAALTEALTIIKNRPVALLKNMTYSAEVGQEITYDTSDSYVVGAEITKYEWDFEGDGVFDLTTTEPVASHIYSTQFDGTMQVRLSATNGTVSNASAFVKIGTYTPPVRLAAPTGVAAKVLATTQGVSSVQLSWATTHPAPSKWAISVDGTVLGVVEAGQTSVEITDIQRKADVVLGVAALATDGTISETATATVAAEVPSVPTTPVTPAGPLGALLACIKKIVAPLFFWWR